MLIGVSVSWNTRPAARMVTTSLKIPAMERVTTDVRCRSANSEAVMQNAIAPGKRSRHGPNICPFTSMRFFNPSHKSGNPSTGIASKSKEANIIGAR